MRFPWVGQVAGLESLLEQRVLKGNLVIVHTRWATHGKPSKLNAHPHLSSASVAVVHNGIIENHEPLRRVLQEKKRAIDSILRPIPKWSLTFSITAIDRLQGKRLLSGC